MGMDKSERELLKLLEADSGKNTSTVYVAGLGGGAWFVGWLFTIGFADLGVWRALLALLLWPYYAGTAAAP